MTLDHRRIQLRLRKAWRISRTPPTHVITTVVVKLGDGSNGLFGLGETAPIARYNESPATVETFLRRIDPRRLFFERPAESMAYVQSLSDGDAAAKCALNVALLDGAAKRRKLPIHDFLGFGFREGRHTTSYTIGIDVPEVIREKVLAAADFPVLKVKAGGPDDALNLRVIREVAPAKPVRIDANEAWATKEEALAKIEALAAHGPIELVEQPMPASRPVQDWAWLKQRSPVPLFADESCRNNSDVGTAAECFHGVNVKLVKTGGIDGAQAALQAARHAGLKTMLGCMVETSILISAAAHLSELCDYLDLDGNLLITNDPYRGVTAAKGVLSFAGAMERTGLCVTERGPEREMGGATR